MLFRIYGPLQPWFDKTGQPGVIPHNDRYGLGFYGLFESDDLEDQPVLGDVLNTEWLMEAFYNITLTPWLQMYF